MNGICPGDNLDKQLEDDHELEPEMFKACQHTFVCGIP
jgi:hypothetical protein